MIRKLRRAKGLNVEELAVASGVSFRHVQRIEAGETKNPRADTMVKLATALEVPVGWLLTPEAEEAHARIQDAIKKFRGERGHP